MGILRYRFWKQNNVRQALANSKVLSGEIVPYMTTSLSLHRKITSNTIQYILWINFSIKRLFEPKYHTWIQVKVRSMPKRKIFFEKIVPQANSVKKLLLHFGLLLKNWCECLSESTNYIWKQVSLSCTMLKGNNFNFLKRSFLRKSKSKVPSQIDVGTSFANSNWTFF